MILAQRIGHLLRQIGAVIVHGEQNAFDGQRGIVGGAYPFESGDEFGDSFQRKVLGLHGHDQRVGRSQYVEGEQVQRRRTVQNHQVVFCLNRRQRAAQTKCAIIGRGQLDVGAGQVLGAGQQREPIDLRGQDDLLRRGVAHQYVVDGTSVVVAQESDTRGAVCLGIAVHQEDLKALESEAGCQVDGGGGFANSALLVDETENFTHGNPE